MTPEKKKRSYNREKKRAYDRAYQIAHREEIRAQKKAYREVHRDEIRAWYRDYYNTHPEQRAKKSAQQKIYRETHRDQKRAQNKAYREANPELAKVRQRNNKLKSEYGITTEEYDKVLLSQNNQCPICGREPNGKRLGVDHDHITGEVRGLLCHSCNVALGLLGDDLDRLRRAIDYLEHYYDREADHETVSGAQRH